MLCQLKRAKLLQKPPKIVQSLLISYAGKALRKAQLGLGQKSLTVISGKALRKAQLGLGQKSLTVI